MIDFLKISGKAIKGDEITHEECIEVLNCPDDQILNLLAAAYKVRHHFRGDWVHIQILSNAKSGLCSEDCHYCSQSSVSTAEIEKYALAAQDKLVAEACEAKELNAKRFCMALSGRTVSDSELEKLCGIITEIKKQAEIPLCCSIGFLKAGQAEKLKAAGLDRVNHNINTSERFYPQICTTHTFQDRVNTIKYCKSAGLEVCSGGIVGQGETDDDIIDMLKILREIKPDSIPINFLVPIKGTPFENVSDKLTPRKCLKILALARFIHPESDIRVAGGREYHLRALQPLALYAANSIFVSGYLTTGGQCADDALNMIEDAGFQLDIEGMQSVS